MKVKDKTKAVIFDIDGTLANCDHRKHFITGEKKDWENFFNVMDKDTLNKGISFLFKCAHIYSVTNYVYDNLARFIITGRPVKYKTLTIKWLEKNGIYVEFDKIFFRPENDMRDDDILKKEIYHKEIEPYYDVQFVVEDRDRVVKMWRKLGLTCLQCAEGSF